MKTYTDTPEVRQVATIVFPGYSGNKFAVEALDHDMRLDSYWSGGSRDYYGLVDMWGLGKSIPIPENGTPFSNDGKVFTLAQLPVNIALVKHTIFQGKDLGITVYVHPDNMNRFALPAPADLTQGQRIVLAYTRGRKSSYNGQNRQQMAEYESGFPKDQWEQSKAECHAKGWLNKAGAITDAGRNAIGNTNPDGLKFT